MIYRLINISHRARIQNSLWLKEGVVTTYSDLFLNLNFVTYSLDCCAAGGAGHLGYF